MKIISNETFECYETAFESWSNNGKSITLDGQLLIPLAKVKQAREEMNTLPKDYEYALGVNACLEILDRLISEVEE